ncbi:MAG: VOC family protein [Candidatus Nealsonbacteria bacterium]|nr:VOC family protein [Candidatus Nealsonbacteria bacterium]
MKYHHVALSVSDLEKSLKFYKEVFGFNEEKRIKREDLRIKAILLKLNPKDDLHLELIQPQKLIENKDDFFNLDILGLKHVCFEVENVDEKHKELKAKGYEVTGIKKGKSIKKYFFIKDPDGFMMEICEK